MPYNLFKDFGSSTGYHSSVISTFSLDPAFYDASLQTKLRANGCINNLLITDASMLDEALETLPEAFRHAGRKYLVAPVRSPGCFHPKLALRYGKKKGSLIIGSANVTAAGWSANLELVSRVAWEADSDSSNGEVYRTLIAKSHDWLWGQVGYAEDEALAYKRSLIHEQSPWLYDVRESGLGPFDLADGTQIDLLLSSPRESENLADRMLAIVKEPVEQLTVVSPYWCNDLLALKHLALGIPAVHVMLALDGRPGRPSTFPIDALDDLALDFHPVSEGMNAEQRFLHAKLFLFQTATHDHLFIGSANCSAAALGVQGRSPRNYEALLFRKLPLGTVGKTLGLSYRTLIEASSIPQPQANELADTKDSTFDAGHIEYRHSRLRWTPARAGIGAAVAIQIGAEAIALKRVADHSWRTGVIHPPLPSSVARVRLDDGRVSRPVLITDVSELLRFSPRPVEDSIRRKLDAVLDGRSDLAGLARDIHLLLSGEAPATTGIGSSAGSAVGGTRAAITGMDYETPEDFRNALATQDIVRVQGFQHGENPALQSLLRIVLRGMVSYETSDDADTRDAANAAALSIGEIQDDAEPSDGPSLKSTLIRSHNAQTQGPVSQPEFARNQAALQTAIEKFHDFLANGKSTDLALDLDFVTRTLFMLYLMLHGCTKRYEIEGGDPDVLLPFGRRDGVTMKETVVFLAAQAMLYLWGPNFKRSLMRRVSWDADLGRQPIQIMTLTVLSRWLLAAILSEVRIDREHQKLRAILERQIPNLFSATRAFAEPNPHEFSEMIAQMEENMEMEAATSTRLRAALKELSQRTK